MRSFLLVLIACSFNLHAAKPKVIKFAIQPSYEKRLLTPGDELKDNIVVQLAERMKVEIDFYVCPWARCMRAIEVGHADIIDDLFYSDQRAQYLNYIQPNFSNQTAGFRFYNLDKTGRSISSWDDLIGLNVGYLRGYYHFDAFENTKQIHKISIIDLESMVKMMLAKRIDAFIAAPSFNKSDILPYDEKQLITRQLYANSSLMPLYLGVSKRSKWSQHSKFIEEKLLELLAEKETNLTNQQP